MTLDHVRPLMANSQSLPVIPKGFLRVSRVSGVVFSNSQRRAMAMRTLSLPASGRYLPRKEFTIELHEDTFSTYMKRATRA